MVIILLFSFMESKYDPKNEQQEVFNPEQKEWEENRLKIASLKFGMHHTYFSLFILYITFYI